ncbi:NAD(P)H-dependent oxidoreductase subunit E [candidate division KSB1 bacterium]|nr:NAD(P)H-dependent oxidoreductase subunit E [candidate division KSB1 bacterium]
MTETKKINVKKAEDSDSFDLLEVESLVNQVGSKRSDLIPLLQAVQNHYHYLPEAVLRQICEITEITPADIIGVSTFYPQFRHQPAGEHSIRVCMGTACHVKGAERVLDAFHRHLKLRPGEDTDKDRLFTVEKIACLGCCTLAPVVQIDDVTYGHVLPSKVSDVLKDFLGKKTESSSAKKVGFKKITSKAEVRIGLGSCCQASGSGHVHESIQRELAEFDAVVSVKPVGCVGMCHQTPLMEIVLPDQPSILYARVQEQNVRQIIQKHFKPINPLQKIERATSRWLEDLYTDEAWEPVIRYAIDVRDKPVAAFLGRQKHITTEYCGVSDPVDLNEYQEKDGFTAAKKCLTELSPEAIVETVLSSGLRGRGGAGFPTGMKWKIVHEAVSDQKILICNCDEGDPGAFMDRMLLESYPYRVIEGMMIAAKAIGAHEGIFYIRAEYPLAVKRVKEALQRCEAAGILSDHSFDSDYVLHFSIQEGAGAFVCGEETALIASVEGRRGMPRFRPPFPAESGLNGRPTLINNCETFATVPWIFRNGAESFNHLGTDHSKGTKVFSLAGKVKRGGLIEVPMGISIREIVEDIGGGCADDKKFKAVQIGGPSGGCIPASLAHIPVDYEALTEAGAMMGSGGLVVLDETDCIVDIARYFLSFTQQQSCGKCTFCRIGTKRMLEILIRLCEGKAKKDDIQKLEKLADHVKSGSLCGLGKTAPNPVLSTLRYFRDELIAHAEGRCPAGKCKTLIQYKINDQCIGCTRCAQDCPVGAIPWTPYQVHEIDPERCIRCDTCRQVCPADAVEVG